jgi:broad specificity phosphatase PhoE
MSTIPQISIGKNNVGSVPFVPRKLPSTTGPVRTLREVPITTKPVTKLNFTKPSPPKKPDLPPPKSTNPFNSLLPQSPLPSSSTNPFASTTPPEPLPLTNPFASLSPPITPPPPPQPPLTPLNYNLILIRHGISCANLMQLKQKIIGSHKLYSDPELTIEGRKLAGYYGSFLQEKLASEGVLPIVGASSLMRAQQTADLLLNPFRILIIPHIAELENTSDNNPFKKERQTEELIKACSKDTAMKRDFSLYDPYSTGARSSFDAFKLWLKNHFNQLVRNPNEVLVIVSHGGLIRSIINSLTGKKLTHMKNYEAHKFFVNTSTEPITFNYIDELKYADLKEINVDDNCKLDHCRKPACGSRTSRLSCSELFERSNELNETTNIKPIQYTFNNFTKLSQNQLKNKKDLNMELRFKMLSQDRNKKIQQLIKELQEKKLTIENSTENVDIVEKRAIEEKIANLQKQVYKHPIDLTEKLKTELNADVQNLSVLKDNILLLQLEQTYLKGKFRKDTELFNNTDEFEKIVKKLNSILSNLNVLSSEIEFIRNLEQTFEAIQQRNVHSDQTKVKEVLRLIKENLESLIEMNRTKTKTDRIEKEIKIVEEQIEKINKQQILSESKVKLQSLLETLENEKTNAVNQLSIVELIKEERKKRDYIDYLVKKINEINESIRIINEKLVSESNINMTDSNIKTKDETIRTRFGLAGKTIKKVKYPFRSEFIRNLTQKNINSAKKINSSPTSFPSLTAGTNNSRTRANSNANTPEEKLALETLMNNSRKENVTAKIQEEKRNAKISATSNIISDLEERKGELEKRIKAYETKETIGEAGKKVLAKKQKELKVIDDALEGTRKNLLTQIKHKETINALNSGANSVASAFENVTNTKKLTPKYRYEVVGTTKFPFKKEIRYAKYPDSNVEIRNSSYSRPFYVTSKKTPNNTRKNSRKLNKTRKSK